LGFIQLIEKGDNAIDSLEVAVGMVGTACRNSAVSSHKESAICTREWQKIGFPRLWDVHTLFTRKLSISASSTYGVMSQLCTISIILKRGFVTRIKDTEYHKLQACLLNIC